MAVTHVLNKVNKENHTLKKISKNLQRHRSAQEVTVYLRCRSQCLQSTLQQKFFKASSNSRSDVAAALQGSAMPKKCWFFELSQDCISGPFIFMLQGNSQWWKTLRNQLSDCFNFVIFMLRVTGSCKFLLFSRYR